MDEYELAQQLKKHPGLKQKVEELLGIASNSCEDASYCYGALVTQYQYICPSQC